LGCAHLLVCGQVQSFVSLTLHAAPVVLAICWLVFSCSFGAIWAQASVASVFWCCCRCGEEESAFPTHHPTSLLLGLVSLCIPGWLLAGQGCACTHSYQAGPARIIEWGAITLYACIAFGRAWQHAKYSYRVWESFAHQARRENILKKMFGFGNHRVEQMFFASHNAG
jgi:hypothetical protein